MATESEVSGVSKTTDASNDSSTRPATAAATAAVTTAVTSPQVSIGKRMCLCFFWTIFGLVFFYLVMVMLSTLAKDITLEKLEVNGWPRSASRHTASVTAPVFTLFLLSSPASLWSLFLAVMSACAQFCHFVILSSDLSIYADEEIAVRVFRTDDFHPLFRTLPLYFAHVVGTIGFVMFLVITSERCFGACLRHRKPALPLSSFVACTWIFAVFCLWFGDRLVHAIASGASREHILHPIYFLLPLIIGQIVTFTRFIRGNSPQLATVDGATAHSKKQN